MKSPNRQFNVFNLSMLDVMTGALGAVLIIMIVLLTQKIGIESESCQDIAQELKSTTEKLIKTKRELSDTRKELKISKSKEPSILENIKTITGIIDITADKINKAIQKIASINRELFSPKPAFVGSDDMVVFRIPKKIVMIIDLSGSMDAKRNKYREDRLSQVKAALKMFIAGMDHEYKIDIVFFPAFSENINNKKCPDFRIQPELDKRCLKFEMRDEAYDDRNLNCYKYGFFEGRLTDILSENNKFKFYKKIECLKAYHDTPTLSALEFVLTEERYRDAEGVILFSDGQPDSIRKGQRTVTELLSFVKEKNRFNKKIFTVGVGAEFRNQENSIGVDLLKKMAKQNLGFYIGF